MRQQPIEKKEKMKKKPSEVFFDALRTHFVKPPFWVQLGRVVGLLAATGYAILAYAAGFAAGGLLWGVLTTAIGLILVSPIFYQGTSRAFNVMFSKRSSEHLIRHLENSPLGWAKTIIIILGMVLFTVTAAALSVVAYSAAITLNLPLVACIGLPLCLFFSIWTTMTAAWSMLWTTPGGEIKAFLKRIFLPNKNDPLNSFGAVVRYTFKLAAVFSFVAAALLLAYLSALAPLSLMHQAGIGLLSTFHIESIVNINTICNILIYGVTFGIRIVFAVISSTGTFANKAYEFCDALFNPIDTLKKMGRVLIKAFSSPLNFLKFIFVKTFGLIVAINNTFGSLLTLVPSPKTNMIAAVITSSPTADGSSLKTLNDEKKNDKQDKFYSSLTETMKSKSTDQKDQTHNSIPVGAPTL